MEPTLSLKRAGLNQRRTRHRENLSLSRRRQSGRKVEGVKQKLIEQGYDPVQVARAVRYGRAKAFGETSAS
jgi:hypothetical protein